MRPSALRWLLIISLLAFTLALGACGGDDDNGDGASSAGNTDFPVGAPSGDQQRGGRLTVLASGDVTSLDPGQSYYSFDQQILSATVRPLYSFEPDDDETPVPDLADGEPAVSDDGKTITVKIKRGIRYSPPYGQEVKAADVKYAIERAFTPSVGNQYVGTYFSKIDGVDEFTSGKADSIAGITTPDAYTVRFRITSGDLVGALSLPVTSPVPQAYAKRYDAGDRSTYGDHMLATGPYRVVEHTPGREIRLARNPNWDADSDFRPAHVDTITVDEGNDDPTVATRQVLAGRSMVSSDFQPTPTELRRIVEGGRSEQLAIAPGAGLRFVAINTTIKPFDKVDVRKALAAALDRKAMQTIVGGPLIADVATHMIYPTMQGFEEAGGHDAGADFYEKPEGDLELAKEYMRKAGYADGTYTGTERVFMVGVRNGVPERLATTVQQALEALGFKTNLRLVSQDAMLGQFCIQPKQKVAICPNVAWQRDYSDPRTVIDPLWNPANFQEENNTVLAQYRAPAFAKQVADAVAMPAGDDRVKAFAEIDKEISNELVLGVPYLWDNWPIVRSSNVVPVNQLWNQGSIDLSFTSLT